MNQKQDVRKIAVVGMLCAVAFLMTCTLRFRVSFLTFDLKDAIIAISSLLYGPIYGVASAVLTAVLEFLLISDTGVYGLIMNSVSSVTFAFICGIIYKYRRNFSGAVLSLVLAAAGTVCAMMIANIFITPFYMGAERSEVIGLIPTLLLPFNICKTVINAAVTMIIYKPIIRVLRRVGAVNGTAKPTKSLQSVIAVVVSVAVIVLTVLFIILKMNGAFEIF